MSSSEQLLDIFSTFGTDEKAEIEGRWFPIGKGAELLVARTGNERYNREFKRLVEAKQLDLSDGGPAADAVAEQILLEVQAKTILLGWKGLAFQGAPVDYSIDMAKTLLKVKDFKRKVMAIADSLESFRVREEVAQGNV